MGQHGAESAPYDGGSVRHAPLISLAFQRLREPFPTAFPTVRRFLALFRSGATLGHRGAMVGAERFRRRSNRDLAPPRLCGLLSLFNRVFNGVLFNARLFNGLRWHRRQLGDFLDGVNEAQHVASFSAMTRIDGDSSHFTACAALLANSAIRRRRRAL